QSIPARMVVYSDGGVQALDLTSTGGQAFVSLNSSDCLLEITLEEAGQPTAQLDYQRGDEHA
ncbi:MAG: hypothetical protein OEW09_16460, partial [Anaerolineae bacterium]|nr:hypothetical protein [Anaerolineae bacterium]